jgi:hypothetical protein
MQNKKISFVIFNMLNYTNKIYFEKLGHMQIKIKILFLNERFFVVVFVEEKMIYSIPKKHLVCRLEL